MARKEPATGASFAEKSNDFGGTPLHLLGCGVREKKVGFMTVKAFAVGLYINGEGMKALQPFKGQSAAQLEKSADFYKRLLDSDFSKQLQIVLQRDATGDDFSKNLQDNLKDGVKMLGGSDTDLAKLATAFGGKSFKAGGGVFLATRTPGVLEVGYVDDASKLAAPTAALASVESAPLVTALFEDYLGPKPVSPSAKAAFAAGAAHLLATL